MKKSILLAAIAITASAVAQVETAEARGLRIGFGFGVPFAARPIADPTILQRAEQMQQRRAARERTRVADEIGEAIAVLRRLLAGGHRAGRRAARAEVSSQWPSSASALRVAPAWASASSCSAVSQRWAV